MIVGLMMVHNDEEWLIMGYIYIYIPSGYLT